MIKKMSVYLGNERADSNYIVSYFAGLKIISGQTPLLIKKKTFSQLGGNRDIVGGKFFFFYVFHFFFFFLPLSFSLTTTTYDISVDFICRVLRCFTSPFFD